MLKDHYTAAMLIFMLTARVLHFFILFSKRQLHHSKNATTCRFAPRPFLPGLWRTGKSSSVLNKSEARRALPNQLVAYLGPRAYRQFLLCALCCFDSGWSKLLDSSTMCFYQFQGEVRGISEGGLAKHVGDHLIYFHAVFV